MSAAVHALLLTLLPGMALPGHRAARVLSIALTDPPEAKPVPACKEPDPRQPINASPAHAARAESHLESAPAIPKPRPADATGAELKESLMVASVPDGVSSTAREAAPKQFPGAQISSPGVQDVLGEPLAGTGTVDLVGVEQFEPATLPVDVDALLAVYDANVIARIRAAQFYPEAARREGLAGSVVVGFRIYTDGSVGKYQIRESSGFQLLDDAAMQAVRNAGPFPPIPQAYGKELLRKIPLRYSAH